MNILIKNLRPGVRIGLAWQSSERVGEFIHIHSWVHHEGEESEVSFPRSTRQLWAQKSGAGYYVVRATPGGGFNTFEKVYPASEARVEVEVKYNESRA